jgi:gliding motility-associated-like protein/uncharacterized repeat protein (TIGR01451 family)
MTYRPAYWVIAFFFAIQSIAQTTDLSITLEAQDLSGNAISQAHIYERYNYLLTISNTGAAVTNASFATSFSSVNLIESVTPQSPIGGAAMPTGITINPSNISGVLPSMPNSSSIEILIAVRASPTFLGGATATATVNPPGGTTDVNPSTNSSVISIIMTEVPIDFSISQSQILPAGNAGITNWGDTVQYEMTIMNNSSIEYPLEDFEMQVVNVNRAGSSIYDFVDFNCIAASGMSCPTLGGLNNSSPINITSVFTYYDQGSQIDFPAGASITFRVTYTLSEGDCSQATSGLELIMGNRLTIRPVLNNTNYPIRNTITTETLMIDPCPCTDLKAETVRVSPTGGVISSWNDVFTYDFTFTNNGPLDVLAVLSMINVSSFQTGIDILTVDCISTTGPVACSDFNIVNSINFRWLTNEFIFPANSSISIRATLTYVPPPCTPNGAPPTCAVRGFAVGRDPAIFECDSSDNGQTDSISGLPLPACSTDPSNGTILELTEIQIDPAPVATVYPWGDVKYEIVLKNIDTVAHRIRMKDIQATNGTGILQSIICTATTGGASCPTTFDSNIGVANQQGDTFWEIDYSANYFMPANSSITLEKVINWSPPCQTTIFEVEDGVEAGAANQSLMDLAFVTASVVTPLVPCVDIVVQTFPSVTSSAINTDFEWIIDVTNSNVSVDATNISLSNMMHPDFVITGTPTCTVTAGTAGCMSAFNVSGNNINATISFMNSGSTIQIRIPTRTPSYGGSFENRAEAQPDLSQTGETTPSSNISRSSLFVLTTQTSKSFDPNVISTGEISTLSFTLQNANNLPAQSGISFTDNLPTDVTVAGPVFWINQNGASASFTATVGSSSIGVQDLSIPAGTDQISFGLEVTGVVPGLYTNDFQNFTDLNNIDVSTAFATLEVLPVLDLEVLKTVDILEPEDGDTVTFTIEVGNIGTAAATGVEVQENLPSGYTYISHTTSVGTYDPLTEVWQVGPMAPGEREFLKITVSVSIPGEYINVVTVSSSNTLEDIDPSNNTAQAFARPDCLVVPRGFSPNGDGMNDTFEILCVELYPESELTIYNRYGSLIHQVTGYQNDWDGKPTDGLLHDKNQTLPMGTYFWNLDLKDGSEIRTGWVYITY